MNTGILLLLSFVLGESLAYLRAHPNRRCHATALRVQTNNEQAVEAKSSLSHTLVKPEDFDEYSRFLSPKEEKESVLSEGQEYGYKPPVWQSIAKKILPRRKTKKGALILLRCGLSTFNANQTFTGWLDPPLTSDGVRQCQHAGELLVSEGYEPDVVYTSRLQRSIASAWTVLETMDLLFIPVYKSYRLNQRMYGALEGLSKPETAKEFGPDVVQAWRNSLKARPPSLSRSDPNHPCHDRRYADIPQDQLPTTESLLDCQERARPLFEHRIRQDIEGGKTVLVVAHRDTLRGLAKVIDGLSDDQVSNLVMPSGVPIVYRFDDDMRPLPPKKRPATADLGGTATTSGTFLEKPAKLEQALKQHAAWNEKFEVDDAKKRVATLEKSLLKLRHVDDTFDRATKRQWRGATTVSSPRGAEDWWDDPCEFEEYDVFASDEDDEEEHEYLLPVQVNVAKIPEEQLKQEGPFVVLIRHGRTPHNNLGLFTGWEDPPLAPEGIDDAKTAGRLLKKHGFEFDVVYTSWLTRAVQTAYYAISELDSVWLPIVKSWRLNERMYGELTGKSKKMIANIYGEEQLKRWRRGYTIRPPPTSSYSLSYPGNDVRRAKHFKDLGISWRESINRSLEQRRIVVHRRFPKTESLKDCMDRSIPFYTERIKRDAVDKGKRVLITSHENALRGILMHLCGIPEEAMNQLHLPNGLPLVYDVKGKCITLLDDGSGLDPMKQHDFGPAAKYLFKSCELDDEFFENMEP